MRLSRRAGLVLVVLFFVVIAYAFRIEVALRVASFATDMRVQVGPARDVVWASGRPTWC